MKTQVLTFVLLFSVVISSAFAQSHNSLKSPVLPDHPLVKTMKLLNGGTNQTTAFKSANENFQLNEIESQIWSENEWMPYLRVENIYEAGKRTERLEYFLTQPGAGWELSTKFLYTYENNNISSFTIQTIAEGEPIPQERTLYSYQEAEGNTFLQVLEYQVWSATEDSWVNEDRSRVIIENGVFSEVYYEIWMDGQWELYERYYYEESGSNLIETTQMYDATLEDWLNYEQYIYSDISLSELYDTLVEFIDFIEDGRSFLVLEILPDYVSYEWDDAEEGWIALDRQITEVSSNLKNGATTANSITLQNYDEVLEDWVVFTEYILGYAENGSPVNFSLYESDDIFDEELGNVILNYSEDYNYDENNLLESILQYENLFGDSFKQVNDELPVVGRVLLTWGDVTTSVEPVTNPVSFRLNQAYPNPFNPSTVVPFQIGAASVVKIQVFDMLGRNVTTLVDDVMPAGNHTVRFDGSDLSSGVYLIRMIAPGLQQTRSVTLIK